MVPHASSFIFYRIIIKIADNQDRHKSFNEFDFRSDQTTQVGVICPWGRKFPTFEFEHLWSQLARLDHLLTELANFP